MEIIISLVGLMLSIVALILAIKFFIITQKLINKNLDLSIKLAEKLVEIQNIIEESEANKDLYRNIVDKIKKVIYSSDQTK